MQVRAWREVVRKTWDGFWEDDCLTLGAAVAYYSVFSLAPLLLTVIAVSGLVFGHQAVQDRIQEQVQGLIGPGAADQLQAMLMAAARPTSEGITVTLVSLVIILFGATGAFSALQDALNRIWHVTPDPRIGGLRQFLTKRIWSLGMILGVAFLLIVSLVLTAVLAAMSRWLGGFLPPIVSTGVLQTAATVASFIVVTLLFGAIFRVLPDAEIRWRDVWLGATLTSLLFSIGKNALGVYLGRSAIASAFGAAGSLMLIVIWLYYASVILLLGAEFTKFWAASCGRVIRPEPGAVGVVHSDRIEQVQTEQLPGSPNSPLIEKVESH